MEWGTPVWWGWFLLFSRSGGHKTKETYPTRPGSPTPCKQGLRLFKIRRLRTFYGLRTTAGRALSFVRSTGLSRANIER